MSTVALLEDSNSDPELDELLSKGPVFLQNVKPSTPPKRATDPITPGMKEEETVMQKGMIDCSYCCTELCLSSG